MLIHTASPTPNRNPPTPASEEPDSTAPTVFRHSFDLTKRLTLPTESAISFIPVPSNTDPSISPYDFVLEFLTNALATTTTSKIHRFIMPTLLSPALYPPDACNSTFLLPFLHSLRSILRIHCHRLSVMLTIPLSLHPRSTGLVCWIEQLCDGVFELAPFPHRIDLEPPSSGVKKTEEKPQGMVKVHKLPVLTEKGGGGGGADDLAFSLSRKRFTIKPYSLPPLEGDNEAQRGDAEGGQMKVDIEF